MNKVYFTKDIKSIGNKLPEDFVKDATLIWHDMYDRPEIPGVKEIIPWEKYRITYNNVGATRVILVGLNRMIVPSNRCDFVHTYLTTLTPNVPKIVIDTAPFIGEPWRLFFHYLFSHTNKFGADYSYPLEGEWTKWFLRETNECKFSASNVRLFTPDTYSDLDKLDTLYDLYEVPEEGIEWYGQVKEHVLNKHNTPKMWVTGLLSEVNKKYRLKFSFESYLSGGVHRIPDLGIYRFVVEECQRRQNIYNSFTKL